MAPVAIRFARIARSVPCFKTKPFAKPTRLANATHRKLKMLKGFGLKVDSTGFQPENLQCVFGPDPSPLNHEQ